jgi:hypothetical protein
VYRDGVLVEEVADISEYWTDDMVGFLLGCSFSWELALEEAGLCPRHVEEGRNVPMYRTAIENERAGAFKGNLVVSMRPYSPEGASKVAAITQQYPGAHGGPVQIGLDKEGQEEGSRLGIKQGDLASPNWGESVTINEGEVPVFWACGVTPQTAIMDAKLPLVLTHSPGHMFVTDLLCSETRTEEAIENAAGSAFTPATATTTAAASSSGAAITTQQIGIVNELERAVSRDEGGRGIGPLVQYGDLLKAAVDIASAERVAIVTGFPCLIANQMPQETDGPLGAVALARTIASLGHEVVIVTDDVCAPALTACIDAMKLEAGSADVCSRIVLESFAGGDKWGRAEEARLDAIAGSIDHCVSIERAGPSSTGTYLTASAKDMTHILAPLDRLINHCAVRGVRSTGIGDGGNEVGMGKVFGLVHQFVKNGPVIACVTKTDNLVVASVSNWGGYALSAAIALVANGGPLGPTATAAVVNVDQEAALCQALVDSGAADGLTGKCELSIDGMSLETSLDILRTCSALVSIKD